VKSPRSYLPTASAFYLSYFVHGMAVIALAQHSAALQAQWQVGESQVLLAISGIGIGKVLGAGVGGALSDRFGRRPIASLGTLCFIAYFIGILFSPGWQVGFGLAVLMGLANAMLDGGSYPTLMESYPQRAGSMVLLVKIFVSGGQLVLPLAIAALLAHGLYWGWTLIACAALMAVVFVLLQCVPFPDYRALAEAQQQQLSTTATHDAQRERIGVEAIALVAIGFTSTATFWLAQTSLPSLGQHLAGMAQTPARALVSIYSAGSLLSVFITGALIARWFKEVQFLVLYPTIAALAYFGLLVFRDALAYQVLAFVIGFTAAGGVLQLALTVMAKFYPGRKGRITGIINTASSLSAFVLPYVTGLLIGGGGDAGSYRQVVLVGAGVALLGTALSLVVLARYRRVFGVRAGTAPTLADGTVA